MELRELALNGAITQEAITSGEVTRFRDSIRDRLKDAANSEISSRTRLELAYYAILDCALLALRVEGYRTKSERGHHRVALQTLEETVGASSSDIDYYFELARIRSASLYGATPISESDAREALEAARELAEKVNAWVKFRLKGV